MAGIVFQSVIHFSFIAVQLPTSENCKNCEDTMHSTKTTQTNQLKKYKCNLCDYHASSMARVGQHIRVHSAKRPFSCSFAGCSFRTKYPQGLKDHEPRHDPVLSTRYKCSVCSKSFCRDYQLKRHVRVHTQEKSKKCPHCDFKAVNWTGLVSHKKKVHGIGKVGKRCQASKYKAATSVHVKIHFKAQWLQDGTTVYKCLFSGCDCITKSKECILTHRRTVHNPSHIVCTFRGCEMKFKTPFLYRNHMKSHDSNRLRNHPCPLCNKKCFDLNGLKRHIKAHTGEKVYQCPFCDYDSVENSNVYRHIRRYHPNDRKPGLLLRRKSNVSARSMNAKFRGESCDSAGESETSLHERSVGNRGSTVCVRKIEHRSHGKTYAKDITDCRVAKNRLKRNNKIPKNNKQIVPVVVLQRLDVKFVP